MEGRQEGGWRGAVLMQALSNPREWIPFDIVIAIPAFFFLALSLPISSTHSCLKVYTHLSLQLNLIKSGIPLESIAISNPFPFFFFYSIGSKLHDYYVLMYVSLCCIG